MTGILGGMLSIPFISNTIFTDNFNRANGNLESSPSWTLQSGSAGSLTVTSNVVAQGATLGFYTAPDIGTTDHFCQYTIVNAFSSSSIRLIYDYVDVNNYSCIALSAGVIVCLHIADSNSTVASSLYNISTFPFTIRVECIGGDSTIYANGFILFRTKRYFIGATKVGLTNQNNNTTYTADDFSCGSLSPLKYTLTFQDNFNRANENLEASPNWTRTNTGVAGSIVVSGNAMTYGNGAANTYIAPDTSSVNNFMQYTYTAAGSSWNLLMSSYVDSANSEQFVITSTGTLSYSSGATNGAIGVAQNIGTVTVGQSVNIEAYGGFYRVSIAGAAPVTVKRIMSLNTKWAVSSNSTAFNGAAIDNYYIGKISDINAPVCVFNDNFTRANSNLDTSGGGWTLGTGSTSANLQIASNLLKGLTGTGWCLAPDTGSSNHYVNLQYTASGTTNSLAAIVDYVDANNYMIVYKKSTTIYYRVMAIGILGAETSSGFTSSSTANTIRLDCIGGNVYVYSEGALLGTIPRSFPAATIVGVYTDATSVNGTIGFYSHGKTGPYSYGYTVARDTFDSAADGTVISAVPLSIWTVQQGSSQFTLSGGKALQVGATNTLYTTGGPSPITATNKFVQIDFVDRIAGQYTPLFLFDYTSTSNFSYIGINGSNQIVYATGYSITAGGTENNTGFNVGAPGTPVTIRVECISGKIIVYANGQYVGTFARGTASSSSGLFATTNSNNQTVDNFKIGVLY